MVGPFLAEMKVEAGNSNFNKGAEMQVEKSEVRKLRISGVEGLDPVSAILEDLGPGRGKLIVECYGKAWSCYWGAMGEGRTISDFIIGADVGYIAEKMTDDPRTVVDYDRIARECNIDDDLDVSNLLFYQKEVMNHFGNDWPFCLPEKQNPDYIYLKKIVEAVKNGVKHQLVDCN